MDPHRLAELRSIAYHRAIAGRLPSEPQLLEDARVRAEGWRLDPTIADFWAEQWLSLLSLPIAQLQRALVPDSEQMRQLRQSTPFAGALSARQRWAIWREVGANAP